MAKFVVGGPYDRITQALCAYLGVDPAVIRRIVIDLQVGSAAKIYYETFADDEVLEVALESLRTVLDDDSGQELHTR